MKLEGHPVAIESGGAMVNINGQTLGLLKYQGRSFRERIRKWPGVMNLTKSSTGFCRGV